MPRQYRYWALALGAILISRLVSMALFPFVDTTEARYAEVARLMAETGDWITPWFEAGVPFWGKPPLSFWAQAASAKVFGLNEFYFRLPALMATILTGFLTWRLARGYRDATTSRWSVLIFASMALPYTSAGAVMTDAFLALGITLSLLSFFRTVQGGRACWGWLFFLGLAIGFLAKGPLATILVGIPIVLGILFGLYRLKALAQLPWFWGSLVTLVLTLPWYLSAELKTPGFLDYFIVGEHILRFIDPGWSGDLYGRAHSQPKGMIWVFWLWASFPWGILALVALGICITRSRARCLNSFWQDKNAVFLLFCAIGPLLFFTLASNTLWTYVLPSLPFCAVLIGRQVSRIGRPGTVKFLYASSVAVCPLLLLVITLVCNSGLYSVKSEKNLVDYYNQRSEADSSPLLYLGKAPFSARFYSRGRARSIHLKQLESMREENAYREYFVAIPAKRLKDSELAPLLEAGSTEMQNLRFRLLSVKSPISHRESSNRAEFH
ncbi:ArnT family glycosyltransferase [Microbulbifer spongiae]|uniref:Glycosyltransferase family 39 protein n=1 Tax=Microbulbifer spongiae TaxID=2944933 RepID=A0ABY9E8Z6_9GAMM|nr:glycosyltransferase family 39 protein [Microbulbifer sp. MI-G]WKD48588.1 glycosyltransferase family 39 protein [Microbulbifer sp. MI-G]